MLRRSRSKERRSRHGDESGATEEAALPTGSGALVVVDEDGPRELLRRLVERAGLEPTAVDSRDSALEAVDAHLPMVVVTLMEGPRGLEVVDALRSHERPEVTKLRVLFACDDHDVEGEAWRAGVDGFLVRPFHADEFTDALRAVVDRSDADRDAHRLTQLEALDDE